METRTPSPTARERPASERAKVPEPAPEAEPSSPSATSRALAVRARLGGGPPSPPAGAGGTARGRPSALAWTLSSAGGPRVQRKCACGGTCERCRAEAEEEQAGLAVQRAPLPGTAASAGALLVDGAAGGEGQVGVSAWLDALEGRLRGACDAALAVTGRDTEGCPYLERWLAFYRTRPAAEVERAARRYTAAGARTPAELADAVVSRARAAAARWALTGQVPELPGGVGPDGMPPVQAKAAEGGAGPVSAADPAGVRARLGPGGSLDPGARSRLEAGFGTSFSGVRVHTDTRAAQLSRELGARAFTVGRDVAFGAGEYRPGTLAGDALIAHELAHTVQQSGGGLSPAAGESRELEDQADAAAAGALGLVDARPLFTRRYGLSLQRCGSGDKDATKTAPTPTPTPKPPPPPLPVPSDFQVLGRNEAPGNAMSIFFDRGSSVIPASQQPKIALIVAGHPKDPLTLNGYRSEDEPATLAEERAKAVAAALAAATPKPSGTVTPVGNPAHGTGRIEYRDLRVVEVQVPVKGGPAVVPPAKPSCAGGSVRPCGGAFAPAQKRADKWLDKAIGELGKTPLPKGAESLLTELFGGPVAGPAAAPTVKANLEKLKTHVGDMSKAGRKVCHNECDTDCASAPAFNTGVDPASVMTLCPGFLDSTDVDGNAETLVHEGSHGTAGLVAKDFAYGHTRLIRALTPAVALKNADSYTKLVRLIASPGSTSIGVAGDTRTGMSPAEDAAAAAALAHMEKWLTQAYQDLETAYGDVSTVRSTGSWPGDFGARTLHRLAPLFGLTDPGAMAPFSTAVTDDDKFKLAAIYDRFLTMRSVMWSTPVAMNKVAAGSDKWAPGPGASVDLTAAFFALPDDVARIRRLLELIAEATPNVSVAVRPKYVDAADAIRKARGLGP